MNDVWSSVWTICLVWGSISLIFGFIQEVGHMSRIRKEMGSGGVSDIFAFIVGWFIYFLNIMLVAVRAIALTALAFVTLVTAMLSFLARLEVFKDEGELGVERHDVFYRLAVSIESVLLNARTKQALDERDQAKTDMELAEKAYRSAWSYLYKRYKDMYKISSDALYRLSQQSNSSETRLHMARMSREEVEGLNRKVLAHIERIKRKAPPVEQSNNADGFDQYQQPAQPYTTVPYANQFPGYTSQQMPRIVNGNSGHYSNAVAPQRIAFPPPPPPPAPVKRR